MKNPQIQSVEKTQEEKKVEAVPNILPEYLLRVSQILGDKKKGIPPIIPISRSAWWLGVKSGRYPKGVKLSERVTCWRAEDIRTGRRGITDDPDRKNKPVASKRTGQDRIKLVSHTTLRKTHQDFSLECLLNRYKELLIDLPYSPPHQVLSIY
jgi:hypothetical protein